MCKKVFSPQIILTLYFTFLGSLMCTENIGKARGDNFNYGKATEATFNLQTFENKTAEQ